MIKVVKESFDYKSSLEEVRSDISDLMTTILSKKIPEGLGRDAVDTSDDISSNLSALSSILDNYSRILSSHLRKSFDTIDGDRMKYIEEYVDRLLSDIENLKNQL